MDGIPAFAGMTAFPDRIPAFAGMTGESSFRLDDTLGGVCLRRPQGAT